VEPDSVFYIYVVDNAGKLLGTVRIRRLITSDLKTEMRDLLEDELKSESVFKIARIRLVFLLICLMGTMVSGL